MRCICTIQISYLLVLDIVWKSGSEWKSDYTNAQCSRLLVHDGVKISLQRWQSYNGAETFLYCRVIYRWYRDFYYNFPLCVCFTSVHCFRVWQGVFIIPPPCPRPLSSGDYHSPHLHFVIIIIIIAVILVIVIIIWFSSCDDENTQSLMTLTKMTMTMMTIRSSSILGEARVVMSVAQPSRPLHPPVMMMVKMVMMMVLKMFMMKPNTYCE